MIAIDVSETLPPAPATLAEAGLSFDLVLQLVVKTLHAAGALTASEIAATLGVQFGVVEPCLELLKRERHCEIAGGAAIGGPLYQFRLTDAGRVRAGLFFDQNQYLGFAPVPIEQYQGAMR